VYFAKTIRNVNRAEILCSCRFTLDGVEELSVKQITDCLSTQPFSEQAASFDSNTNYLYKFKNRL